MPAPKQECTLSPHLIRDILGSPPDRIGRCDCCGVHQSELHFDPATEGFFEMCHDCWIGQYRMRRVATK